MLLHSDDDYESSSVVESRFEDEKEDLPKLVPGYGVKSIKSFPKEEQVYFVILIRFTFKI